MVKELFLGLVLLSSSSLALANMENCYRLQNTTWQSNDQGKNQRLHISSVKPTDRFDAYGLFGTLTTDGVTHPFTFSTESVCISGKNNVILQITTASKTNPPNYKLVTRNWDTNSSAVTFDEYTGQAKNYTTVTMKKQAD